MEENVEIIKSNSLIYCEKLLDEIRRDQEEADLFFGGELHAAYASALDKVMHKVTTIRTKIKNL